jgi:hypothetical protein
MLVTLAVLPLRKRIKGLCGAKPPQKPCWTDAVMLGGWLDGLEPWEPGAGERYR